MSNNENRKTIMRRIPEEQFNPEENWQFVQNFNGRYLVSDNGRFLRYYDNGKNTIEMKQQYDKDGYLRLPMTTLDGIRTTQYTHRIIAQEFVPNPDPEKYNIVNHKNEVKDCNYYKNLEWCDTRYNNMYGLARSKAGNTMRDNNNDVYQFDLTGKLINKYNGVVDASEQTGIYRPNIGSVCRGRQRSAGGFYWSFNYHIELDERGWISNIDKEAKKPNQVRKVLQMDDHGNIIREYNSIRESARETGFSTKTITDCCDGVYNHCGGYVFKYKEN